ncbi:hypothetical protein MO973_25215 [Paenibacillus sp. TRM 82003]|nr:hypothetical protein [Paenibacillus sp. TRM 82003]
MIITSLIIGAALLVGGSLIARFWNDIIGWLKRGIEKVKTMIRTAVYGTKVFVRKMREAVQEISKHYAKDRDNRWNETVVTREVSESEVPPEIRAMAQRGRETDITDQLAMQLSA